MLSTSVSEHNACNVEPELQINIHSKSLQKEQQMHTLNKPASVRRRQIVLPGAVRGAEAFPDPRTPVRSEIVVHSPQRPLALFMVMMNCLLSSHAYHQFHSYY